MHNYQPSDSKTPHKIIRLINILSRVKERIVYQYHNVMEDVSYKVLISRILRRTGFQVRSYYLNSSILIKITDMKAHHDIG